MKKEFDIVKDMQDFLFENEIYISFFELTDAIKNGYLFTTDYDFECYFDEFNNEYVLEG